MKRAVLATVTTVAALALLLGFKTHPTTALAHRPAAISGTGGPTPSATETRTVTGDAADTRYGPVQVRVTLSGGRVTAATAVDYPTRSPRDYQINSYAIPVLNQEAVDANSANIDMVSGATFTSIGYQQSLQSALDKAGAK